MKDFESWVRESPAVDRRLEVAEIFKPYGEWQFGDLMLRVTDGSEHVFEEKAYSEMIAFLKEHMSYRTEETIITMVKKRMPDLWLWAGR